MIDFILIAAGGAIGAIARAWVSKNLNNKYPLKHLGTLSVNIIGSLLLGIMINLHLHSHMNLFIGIGFLGSFTTFSTLKVEIIGLMKSQKWKQSFLYLTLTYTLGIGMAAAGFWIVALFV